MVTHYGITAEDCERAVAILRDARRAIPIS
jgi:hypothetical protein